jgi:hypothetical protein
VKSIHHFLATLAAERPIFHSEADFQHAFAWLLHREHPELSVRLEVPLRVGEKMVHIDLLAGGEETLGVELKYKTRAVAVDMGGEEFRLSSHAAQDLGRYDFIKDIERLELLAAARRCTRGYAVLLTNDSAYWTSSRREASAGAAFRLDGEQSLAGMLAWGPLASAGTAKGRERALEIAGAYPREWKDYSRVEAGGYPVFRYLAVEVRPRIHTDDR